MSITSMADMTEETYEFYVVPLQNALRKAHEDIERMKAEQKTFVAAILESQGEIRVSPYAMVRAEGSKVEMFHDPMTDERVYRLRRG